MKGARQNFKSNFCSRRLKLGVTQVAERGKDYFVNLDKKKNNDNFVYKSVGELGGEHGSFNFLFPK